MVGNPNTRLHQVHHRYILFLGDQTAFGLGMIGKILHATYV